MLVRFLQYIRLHSRRSRLARLLRLLGIVQYARSFYNRKVLEAGEHSATLHGRRFRFIVSSPEEISRIDSVMKEDAMIEQLLDAVQPGDVVFDVGANIGVLTILVAAHGRDRNIDVHSFEPEPQNVDHLRRNAELNGLNNVHAHPVALGQTTETASLFLEGGVGGGTHSILESASEGRNAIEIDIERGDEFCQRMDLFPTVFKIDVEGAEMDVLMGFTQLFEHNPPREILIEVHPDRLQSSGHSPDAVEQWLEQRGYTRLWHWQRGGERHERYSRLKTK